MYTRGQWMICNTESPGTERLYEVGTVRNCMPAGGDEVTLDKAGVFHFIAPKMRHIGSCVLFNFPAVTPVIFIFDLLVHELE